MNKAVLFIIFNRLNYAKKVFEQIKIAKPKKLYIASDGARENRPEEKEQVENVRNWVLANINWDCEIKTRFLEKNSGKIGLGVSGAIDWFFENEEDGIIFEEDCVPNQSFFSYCEELLDKYKDDKRIWHITGDAIYEKFNQKDTYYYAKIPHIWGWATWADRWKEYKYDLIDYDEKYIENFSDRKDVQEYWLDILKKMKTHEIDTWDYQWAFCVVAHKGYCITPYKNLINNIGDIGVHSSKNDPRLNRKTYSINKIVHPKQVKFNNKIIDLIYTEKFGIKRKYNLFYKKEKEGNKRIITLLGFIKIKYKKQKEKKHILENVMHSDFKKKVLISYIKNPFTYGLNKTHTNLLECYTVAEIFNNLGYQVDVIDYLQDIDACELNQYAVVYGFGNAFNKSLYYIDIKSIYYGTGCCTNFSNVQTVKRLREFYNKVHIIAEKSIRYSDINNATTLYYSDCIIALGNEFVANSYKLYGINQNIKSLDCFYYDVYDINTDYKDFDKCKKNFVWFGSLGALHKGLDILIEIFKRRKDINLTICGFSDTEDVFQKFYKDVFDNKYSNIKNLGFLDIESDEFKELMDNHIAIISPSASEGGAASVLNVMANGGLIPIISKASGLNVEQYGYMFEEISEENVEGMIDKLLKEDINNLKNLSKQIKNETREKYSYKNYKENLSNIIKEQIV